MYKLDHCRETQMTLSLISAKAGTSEGQERTQPLAARSDDMAGELRNEANLGLHVTQDEGIDCHQILSAQLRQRLIRRGSRPLVGPYRD